MRIGELARRTDVPTRMLRYYEEQGLLGADREDNGYRSYPEAAAGRALQIRGLLGSGLTTEIIRDILPCLDDPQAEQLMPDYLAPELAEMLTQHLARVQQRIECLTRNRDAIQSYITAVSSRSQTGCG
jgi:DNA-binding transcriptional MerR regulator